MSPSSTISKPCPAQPKRLIICCDGTWQSSTALDSETGAPSNVAKLCRVLAGAGTPNEQSDDAGTEYQQVVYYDAGVGTGQISIVDRVVQGGEGAGLLEKVIEAYNFIVNNFTKGDKLYFFGFSRGAFTARACAGLVWEVGILWPSAVDQFLRLYSKYVNDCKFEVPFAETEAWKAFVKSKNHNHAVIGSYKQPVDVIGVWDTVGALGVPDVGHLIKINNSAFRKQYQFHDVELNPGVKHAYQALSLDDRRGPFHPSVWKATKTKNPDLELLQTWFPGVHKDVGGGFDTSDGEGDPQEQLASISYAWMLDRIRPHLAFDTEELKAQQANWTAALQLPTPAQAAKAQKARGLVAKISNWWGGHHQKDVHGYALEEITDTFTALYEILGNPTDRIPLNLSKNDLQAQKYTNETVHFSVHIRQEGLGMSGYTPQALKGWERRLTTDGGYEWYKPATTGEREKVMPEFQAGGLPEEDSMEIWLLRKAGLAKRQ